MQTLIPTRPGRWGVLMVLLLATGCAMFGGRKQEMTLRFHEQADDSRPPSQVITVDVPRTNLRLRVNDVASLTERDVQEASLIETAGGAAVMLKFDVHGAIKLDEMTTRCRGRYVVIFMNDRPVAAVLLDQRLTLGQFLLEGDFTDEEARQLVESLHGLVKNQQRRWLNNKW